MKQLASLHFEAIALTRRVLTKRRKFETTTLHFVAVQA